MRLKNMPQWNEPTLGQCSAKRVNNFDFIRFFLASLVVFSHSYLLTGRQDEPFERFTHGQINGGAAAVVFFFIISGFLITGSWVQSGRLDSFVRKRVLRIYPGFVAAVLFSLGAGAVGAGSLRRYFSDPQTYGFLNQLLLRRPTVPVGAFSHNPVPGILNGSLWTIGCELVLYGMVALFGLMGLYRKRHTILGLFLTAIIGYKALHFLPRLANHHAWVFGSIIVMAYFLMPYLAGMVCYLYRDLIPLSLHLFLGCLCLLVLSLHSLLWLTLPICGAYTLFYVAFSPALRLSGFGQRGDFSYGIYLYAFPIQQLLIMYLPRTVGVVPFFVASWLLSFAAANVSWRLIERPAMRWKQTSRAVTPDPVTPAKTANFVLSGY